MRNLGLLLLLLAGCDSKWPLNAPGPVPASARQVVEVRHFGPGPASRLYMWQRHGDAWQAAITPIKAVVGKNLIAPPGKKREGDGCTPAGVFAIGPAFGAAATADTRLEYRQITADDYWVDDPASPDYNRWVHGPKPTARHEVLRQPDGLYDLGAVIRYNTDEVVAGRGSAIFLHIWKGPEAATAGCVAVDRADLEKLLAWLDASQSPVIVIRASD